MKAKRENNDGRQLKERGAKRKLGKEFATGEFYTVIDGRLKGVTGIQSMIGMTAHILTCSTSRNLTKSIASSAI